MTKNRDKYPRFVLSVGNFAWQRNRDGRLAKFLSKVDYKLPYRRPTAVAGVEMHDRKGTAPVAWSDFLPESDYYFAQDTSGGQKAGSGYALRRGAGWKIIETESILGSDAGPGVGPRYIRRVVQRHRKGAKRTILVVHFPLGHTGRQDDFRRVLKRVIEEEKKAGTTGCVVGDINSNHLEVRKQMGLDKSWGIPNDVMMIAVWGDWGPVKVRYTRKAPWATDHAVFTMFTGPATTSKTLKKLKPANAKRWWKNKRKK